VTLSVERSTDVIAAHAQSVAKEAPGALDVAVEHCPGWTVATLLQHLIEVHWIWALIVEERLTERPEEGRPVDIPRDELAARFLSGADHLVDVLRSANQNELVWTWAPLENTVAFVTRHQVQEMAVHHWDVAHAVGRDVIIEADVACDAAEEFLTFSVSSSADPMGPPLPGLNRRLGLQCTDADQSWTVFDDGTPGTITFVRGLESPDATLSATSSDFLLWLYSRVDIAGDANALALGAQLHTLSFTD
jgi:uncharacterized protein (TIGR03083 family)